MSSMDNVIIQNRTEAGRLLAKKLREFKRSNAVVIGIPKGGVCVASAVAESLALPLEVMPCRKLKDPSHKDKDIGSVSANEALIHDLNRGLPQEYIYRQMLTLKNAIQHDNEFYYGDEHPVSLQYKSVILVDDVLSSSDSIIACLREIKRQKPLKIIIAVPFVSAEAARVVSAEADGIVFLRMEPVIQSPHQLYAEFPRIDHNSVRELLSISKRALTITRNHS
jgi:putative phosphoribosyl transferase